MRLFFLLLSFMSYLVLITYDAKSQNVANFTITSTNDSICLGDSTQLLLNFDNNSPCTTTNDTNCYSTPNQFWGDTGTVNISSSPTPYYGFFDDGRIQILYTTSELNALGFTGGKITELAFEVTGTGGQSYTGYSISMMCSPLNSFDSLQNFIPGSQLVYFDSVYTTIPGINNHILDSPFVWDGTSNLITEICFNNESWTTYDPIVQTTQNDSMCLYAYDDNRIGCNLDSSMLLIRSTSIRPNIRFTYCSANINPNHYSYYWSPSSSLSYNNIQNPIATPNNSTMYTVVVTDTNSNNFKTDSILITVDICTSIPHTKTLYNLKIYPNPTDGLIHIKSSLKIKKNATINLMSIEGKLVYSKLLLKDLNSWDFDLSHLNKGVYFLHFNYNYQKSIKKIILN